MWQAVVLALLVAFSSAGSAQAQTNQELIAKLLQLQQGGIENVGRALAGQTSQRALQASLARRLGVPVAPGAGSAASAPKK